jgi:hypothetical protein
VLEIIGSEVLFPPPVFAAIAASLCCREVWEVVALMVLPMAWDLRSEALLVDGVQVMEELGCSSVTTSID